MATLMPIYRARNLHDLMAKLSNMYKDHRATTFERLQQLYRIARDDAEQQLNVEGDQENAYLSYCLVLEYLNMMMNHERYLQASVTMKNVYKKKKHKYEQVKLALELELEQRYQAAIRAHRDARNLNNDSLTSEATDADIQEQRLKRSKQRHRTLISTDRRSYSLRNESMPESACNLNETHAATPYGSIQHNGLTMNYLLPQDDEQDTSANSSQAFESTLVELRRQASRRGENRMRPRNPTPPRLSQLNLDKLPHIRNAKPPMRECVVCITNKPISDFRQILSPTCNHSKRQICTDCVRRNIQTLIKESTLADIRCPELDCHAAFDFDTVQRLLQNSNASDKSFKTAIEKFEDRLTKEFLEKMKNFTWCAHGCGWGGELPRQRISFFTCNCCGKKTCVYHKTRWHDGMTCPEYDERLMLNREEERNRRWKQANTKSCPNCQVAIEKNQGCDHMTCRNCKHEFCWLCLVDYQRIRRYRGRAHKTTCDHYEEQLVHENEPNTIW